MDEQEIKTCVESLNKAAGLFLSGTPAAREGDGFGAMTEAKRNLIALVQSLHGDDAWRRAQDW